MGLTEVLRVVCVVAVVVGAHPTLAKRIPRWWMKVAQRQGPNACVVEEVPQTGLEFWTECRYWLNRKVCGRRTRIRFECCEGFERNDDENGCTRVKPLMNLLETAESLGATKWAQYIRDSGLAGELESAAAYTLFAPTNEAFENLRGSLRSQMEAYRGSPNNPVLLYHLLPTKLLSDDFQADMLAETRHQGHSVRINKYSNGMTTVNCALLIRKDQHATNGVVHLLSDVLDPSIGTLQNVADMVLNDGRFTVLADVLQRSGYINILRTMQGSVTVLAPSDEAFQKLSESRREKIINDREARLALIQNHVIPHVICESAVTGEHRVSTVSRDKLTFSCDISGTYVETTRMRGNFNLGQNGIVHMIDDVLLPDRAKNLLELAESRQLHTFVDLVKKAGLEETLTHTGDYTFFVPDEAAWYALDSQVLDEARRDLDLAGQLVRFHGAYGRHLTNAITDNQAIMTLNEEDPVRLQVWRRGLGVEDARITEPDLEAQNGVIHIINKVITPSNESIDDVLRSIPGQSFETFLEAVRRVSQESEEGALLSLGPGDEMFYTFFVPSGRAFTRVNQAMLRRLRQDDAYTRQMVRQHVAVNMFPETSFEKNLIYTVNGMAAPFDIKKTRDNVLKVNGEEVTSSHLCANGVIHVIKKAFMPDASYTGSYDPLPSRTSTRRTYKKTVTFAERYNGIEQELPGVPQGSVDSPSFGATRRRATKKRGGGSFSPSSSSTTLPPPVAATLTTPPSRSSPTVQDEVEETHLEGTKLEAKEDEASLNALTESPGVSKTSHNEPESYNESGLRDGFGSRPRHGQGSYSVREGSYSSSSYNPSSSTSSTTTTTTTTTSTHSTSILGSRDEEVQSVDGRRREDSSSSSSSSSSSRRRPYDPDLDSSSSSSSSRRTYDPSINGSSPFSFPSSSSSSSTPRRRPYDGRASSSSSSSWRRPYDNDRDSNSSQSSSSFSSTSRRRYHPNIDANASPSSSSSSSSYSSTSTSRRYGADVDAGSSSYNASLYSSSLSSPSTPRRRNPDLHLKPSSSSSSSLSHSVTRTRFEGSSDYPIPQPVPSRLPDGPGSSDKPFVTNHTRHSSQAGGITTTATTTTSTHSTHSTDLRGAVTSLEEPTTNLRGSQTTLRGTQTSLRGSEPTLRSETTLRRSEATLRGPKTNLRGYGNNLRGSGKYEGELNTNLKRAGGEVSGSSTYVRESSTDSSRRGFSTKVVGSSASSRGSSTEIRGLSTEIRGSNTALRGSSTDLRGSSTVVGGGSSGGGLDTRVGGGTRGHTSSSSRTYSYQYTGGASGLEARQDQNLSRQPFDPVTFPSINTPSSRLPPPLQNHTGSRRVSYVGHSYGQDVVGHRDQLTRVTQPPPLPYRVGADGRRTYGREVTGLRSLGEGAGSVKALEGVDTGSKGVGQTVYKYSKTSHVQHVQGPTEVLPVTSLHSSSGGRSTTTIGSVRRSHRRRYNITKTSYSYSVPVLHPRLPPPIRSSDNTLRSLSPVSAYAFTGDEDMYADGTEFAEMKGHGTESIARQEARELRRRFRKKRHHKRRGGKGRRRRGRRGRRNRVSKKVNTAEE